MDLPLWVWLASIGGLSGIVVPDLGVFHHKPHKARTVSVRAASSWSAVWVVLSPFCFSYPFHPFHSGAAKDAAAAPPETASKRSRKGTK